MSNIIFRLTAGTNVGCVRSNNEDNFVVNQDLTQNEWFLPSDPSACITLGEAGCLLVVADGMGGMNAGEVASDIAVKTIEEVFKAEDLTAIVGSEENIEHFMISAIQKADANIKHKVKEDASTTGMGTTIVVAWVIDNKVHLAWCGDSRAYRFNKSFGLTQLTKDHSYVQQLVDDGKLDPELAFDHPHSNIITRSLGDTSSKAQPDYKSYELSVEDVLILCTDGLCGLCRDEEILDVLNNQDMSDITACRDALINAALEAGGHDNVTVALFQFVESDAPNSEYTNTVIYRHKPLYKRPQIWVSLALIMAILFSVFVPEKYIGEKASGFRESCFVKLSKTYSDIKRYFCDKFQKEEMPTLPVDTVIEDTPKLLESTILPSSDSKIDAAKKDDYDQNQKLLQYQEVVDSLNRVIEAEERKRANAAKKKDNSNKQNKKSNSSIKKSKSESGGNTRRETSQQSTPQQPTPQQPTPQQPTPQQPTPQQSTNEAKSDQVSQQKVETDKTKDVNAKSENGGNSKNAADTALAQNEEQNQKSPTSTADVQSESKPQEVVADSTSTQTEEKVEQSSQDKPQLAGDKSEK